MSRTYYIYDDQFYFTGESHTISEYETWPVKSCFTAPPELSEGEYARWNGSEWIIDTEGPKEPVPSSVTKRQGRQQMILMGVIGQIQPAIDAIQDATERALVQSFWEDSIEYERYHPQMISLANQLGFTDDQLDDAFRAASQL